MDHLADPDVRKLLMFTFNMDVEDTNDIVAEPDSAMSPSFGLMYKDGVDQTICDDLLLPARAESDESDEEQQIDYFSSGSDEEFNPHSSEESSSNYELDGPCQKQRRRDQAAEIADQHQTEPQPGCSSWVDSSHRSSTQLSGQCAPAASPVHQSPPSFSSSKTWTPVGKLEQQRDIKGMFRVTGVGSKDIGNSSTPLDFFYLFMTTTMWQMMVDATNKFAQSNLSRMLQEGSLGPCAHLRYWKNVTIAEMKKFWAILLNMGISMRPNISLYWSQNPSQFQSFYQDTMSQFRFELIMSQFQVSSRPYFPMGHANYDPWAKIRDFIDGMNDAFKRYFVPSQEIYIDESTFEIKNCGFIQYMRNKRPSLYGIKKFELCDSASGYVMHAALYYGSGYLLRGKDPFKLKVVTELMQQTGLLDNHYHLFTDNFYTEVPLADFLYKRNTFMTGPINKKSRFLSTDIKNCSIEVGGSKYFKRGSVLLVKYKETKTRKPVLMISTAYAAGDEIVKKGKVTKVKPVMIFRSNKHMGGVDTKDKNIYHLTCSRQTKKYWKKIVYNFVDMALYNAYHLYRIHHNKSLSKIQFIIKIVNGLVEYRPTSVTMDIPRVPVGQITTEHVFQMLEKTNQMVCGVCHKRARFWCPGCNVGVHEKCLARLTHFRRKRRANQKNIPGVTN